MTDRVEVDKLLTHLHELEQLVSGLQNNEASVSFFGESFELIQRISRSVYTIEQIRISDLENQLKEQRSCIEAMSARVKAEEQKVKELTEEKEAKATVAAPAEPASVPVQAFNEKPIIIQKEEPKTISSKVEEKSITSLKETLERKNVSDLRKSFSVNDRFLFKKELFKGDEGVMHRVVDSLNQESSLEGAMRYLRNEMDWDFNSSTAAAFISHLEKRFL